MLPITVRRAELNDLEAFQGLWAHLQTIQAPFRAMRPTRDPDEHFSQEFRSTVGAAGHAWLAAIDPDGAVVGMAHLHVERPSRVSDEEVLEMSRVAILPELRGRGIGRLLVAEAERIAREDGMRYLSAKIFAGNRDALAFWDALDFDPFLEIRLRRVH